MAHKRPGRTAKQQRVSRTNSREMSPEQRLLQDIFGTWVMCSDCGLAKMASTPCLSPQCMAARGEKSAFYKNITDNTIEFHNGAVLEGGIDY